MRIVCPNCNAAYDLPPARVPPGRGVKCARCSESWTPVPNPAPGRGPELDAPPEPTLGLGEGAPPPPDPPQPTLAQPTTSLAAAALPAPHVIERTGASMLGVTITEDEPAALPEAAPAAPAAPSISAASAVLPRRRTVPLALAWCGSALVLAGLGWALVTYRAEVMRAWPPSQRAYAALGLLAQPDHTAESK